MNDSGRRASRQRISTQGPSIGEPIVARLMALTALPLERTERVRVDGPDGSCTAHMSLKTVCQQHGRPVRARTSGTSCSQGIAVAAGKEQIALRQRRKHKDAALFGEHSGSGAMGVPSSALSLAFLRRYSDLSLLCLRVLTGAFLVYGTQDNVFSAARMEEFVVFLADHGFVLPALLAPLSVYAQFLCGGLLILGFLTRWAGLVMTFNFAVAVAMVHWPQDFRGWWPAIVLVFISLHFAFRGGGRYSLDAILWSSADRAVEPAAR